MNHLRIEKESLLSLAMLLLCIGNLFYMHYYIFTTCNIEAEYDITSYYDNFCGVFIDFSIIFALCYFLTLGRVKASLASCFTITLLWSFCNVLYSRFFFRYISLSAIGQSSNLFDWFMIKCMIDEIQISDLYYLIIIIAFILVYIKTPTIRWKRTYRWLSLTVVSFIFINLFFHAIYCVSNPSLRYLSYYRYRLFFTHFDTNRNMGRPNWTNFHRGSIRTILPEVINEFGGTMELNDEQLNLIKNELSLSELKTVEHHVNTNIKNIIFILVESYTAFTTDMKIDGKEVMPFLNRLRHEPDVYYNEKMKSNITIGQSSDGQFLYMSGLLPLRSIITVSKAKKIELPALPKAVRAFNQDIETRMVIPTLPSLWEQDAMCQAYGFDYLYSSNDFPKSGERNLNDEQVFKLAEDLDKKSTKPFLSFILTMSMHGPYTQQIDNSFIIKNKNYCPEFINFLNVCHYTDRQIEKYFAHLKKHNLYDNSLIIIAPDHQVPENTVNTEQYGITRELPLFIINGNIDNKKAWKGECNQIDVYTTLLNVLGIKAQFYGLGNSLLNPHYNNSLENNKWDVSEWILLSNYFKQHSHNSNKKKNSSI